MPGILGKRVNKVGFYTLLLLSLVVSTSKTKSLSKNAPVSPEEIETIAAYTASPNHLLNDLEATFITPLVHYFYDIKLQPIIP